MLRRELDEVRIENEAYKQQLIRRDQDIVVIGGDDDLAELPDNEMSAKKIALTDEKTTAKKGVSKTGSKTTRGRKRGKGKRLE